MKQALIDTDILSYFFNRHARVVENVDKYTDVFDQLNFSILTYYEILSGLIVTHNRKHFEKIAGLEIEDWAEEI